MPLVFKRVATEGTTTDGREISRAQIQEMAESYDPAKFGARVFCEHIRGMAPDSPFRAYGDVRAVKAETVDGGKLALYAQIDPTDDLKAMTRGRQKIYSSVEIDPNFAGTGKAYMVGLGVTDSPASLGTEVLTFAQQHPDYFRTRKQKPENLFSAGAEIDTDFGTPDAPAEKDGITRLIEFFSRNISGGGRQDSPQASPTPPAGSGGTAPAPVAMDAATAQMFASTLTALNDENKSLRAEVAGVSQKFSDLTNRLENTQFSQTRPLSTGGSGGELTDC
ncbi:GPO family capsid scaffolding protein [Paraburkholderia antibiotica]|uniref:GPO family capsid scaffolding protein n=1 Tax=Paraburkholderia antibiotica TaxID=2728839 RepID=A0A7X9X5G2_9BURK|nr:GPO family capsid scaffolding protein [Paraburkholderia antibiotica]NML31796.1 GPO family capsid scaffolding protein [Paraburkholderia antibiotica]